jgi:predicted ArsR family transcriptional regulator
VFPDRHGDLSVDVLAMVRSTLGTRALDRVLAARTERQSNAYATAMKTAATTADRVSRLADIRSDEGYLAEARVHGATMTLIEHHCPIRDAADACHGLCSAELDVFRRVLGPEVNVERTHHVLAGDRRCAYEIRPSR